MKLKAEDRRTKILTPCLLRNTTEGQGTTEIVLKRNPVSLNLTTNPVLEVRAVNVVSEGTNMRIVRTKGTNMRLEQLVTYAY